MNPHEQTVRNALQTGDEISSLFDRIGSADAPRGRILAAYRDAREQLASDEALQRRRVVTIALNDLRDTVNRELNSLVVESLEMGAEQAAAQLRAYDVAVSKGDGEWARPFVDAALLSVGALVTMQIAQIMGLLFAGTVSASQVVGSGSRVGILNPAPVITQARDAVAKAAAASYDAVIERSTRDGGWMRQAVAAIDDRTTDCCLRVSGQTVPLNGEFKLTGTPRFADMMDAPPFHLHCRTALALVRAEDAGDNVTRRMREAALNELGSRQRGDNGTRPRPVNAFGSE